MRIALRLAAAGILLIGLAIGGVWIRYGGGDRSFPDRTSRPTYPDSALEVVAELDLPPGNVAVSAEGRIFFTYHPEASPPVRVAEIVDARPVPYPDGDFQPRLVSPLSLRIDRQRRLWVLDNANHGLGQPRILAFDLRTDEVVYDYEFPRAIAGLGSHLNDFQLDPAGRRVYIADASIFAKRPAIVVLDVEGRRARRLLEGHESVLPERYVPVVDGQPMIVFGVFAVRPGVDSIGLDRTGEWLYFGAVTSRYLYRVRARDLDDPDLPAEALAARVERFAPKPMSDGITTDLDGGIYLGDPEHSAVLRLDPQGGLTTLIRTPRLRWPDGFSFGPDGWLYVTASALQHVIGRSPDHVLAHRPYHVFRLRPGAAGVPGH